MTDAKNDRNTGGNKQYWWIRLNEDFFNSKEMKKLRKIAGGAVYTIIYLKMQLLTLKTGGRIFYDGIEETFADEIALTLDENPDDVTATLLMLERLGLAKRTGADEIFLPEVPKNTGKETQDAVRKRGYRLRKKEEIARLQGQTRDNVPTLSGKNPTEIEIEKEIHIEIESEIEREDPTRAENGVGIYNNVFLTPEELATLQTEIPDAYRDYIDDLSSYKKSSGKEYESDFATIRRWAAKDAKEDQQARGDGWQQMADAWAGEEATK